ncbi:MAG: hypothetical protein AB7V32_09590, partial [Candidatus Berkiella sp.]
VGMVRGAQGKSRFVSLWEGMIGEENATHVIEKLQQKLATLPSKEPQDQTQKEELEKGLLKLNAYTTKHLVAAGELLSDLNFNTIRSLAFLPVRAHKELAENLEETRAHHAKVLSSHEAIIENLQTKPKSWLTQTLHYNSVMVAARASAIGLANSTTPYPAIRITQEEATQNFQKALAFFEEIAQKIEAIPQMTGNPSKTTRQILTCENPDELPSNSSMHWQYCPQNVATTMQSLKTLVRDSKEALTKQAVEKTLEMDFPSPSDPYTPGKRLVSK